MTRLEESAIGVLEQRIAELETERQQLRKGIKNVLKWQVKKNEHGPLLISDIPNDVLDELRALLGEGE